MFIRFGYQIQLDCDRAMPAFLLMEAHDQVPGVLGQSRDLPPFTESRDANGNRLQRCVLPIGPTTLRYDAVLEHDGLPEPQFDATLPATSVMDLPADVLPFLTASRYCESDLLGEEAWPRFGALPPGGAQVQAVFDFVHQHVRFGYENASASRTALQTLREGRGVCRDFAHLAIGLCRALNIPARYCNGYLGDIGVPPDPAPMDFNAWCEVWLAGRWHVLDARHNQPRIGRILIARGRDAAEIPMINSFGPHRLANFKVWTDSQSEGHLTPLALALA